MTEYACNVVFYPQWGGLTGRQLIDNIVDIESDAVDAARQHAPSDLPTILL
jgi:hypothetical protein